MVGTVLGAAALLSSRGMALRALVGGGLYGRYGRYIGLYIGSMAMAMGLAAATAIAMLFASVRRPRARNELKQALQP